jgi:hypothetical protein
MGIKLSWTGLTLILVSPLFGIGQVFALVGAIILAIGVILNWLDK